MNAGSRRSASSIALGRSGSEWNLAPSQRSNTRLTSKYQRNSGMVRSASNLEDASAKASYNVDFDNTPVPQLLNIMKTHLSFAFEYVHQVQRRIADESVESSERKAWVNSFQETLSEHIRSVQSLDPCVGDIARLNKALTSLSDVTNNGIFSTIMEHYLNSQKNG